MRIARMANPLKSDHKRIARSNGVLEVILAKMGRFAAKVGETDHWFIGE
jgi:hypothetical protein